MAQQPQIQRPLTRRFPSQVNWIGLGLVHDKLSPCVMTIPQATSPEGSAQFGGAPLYREARICPLEELVARARLSSTYLSLVERGHRPPPPRGSVGRLLDAAEVPKGGSAEVVAYGRTYQKSAGGRLRASTGSA